MPKGNIEITPNGPYAVSGSLPLAKAIIDIGPDGEPARWQAGEKYPDQPSYILCRCGQSKNKPFCDGRHLTVKFDGTETASRQPYLQQAEKIEGPGMDLTDAVPLCALARFCHRAGGVWDLTDRSADPQARADAIQESQDCPAGRLIAWDKKTKQAIEAKRQPEIGLVEDPQKKVSGPLWVKGGVPIKSADGSQYEVRNQVTLCRCGRSSNKPFCDGSHIEARFNDGDKNLT